MAKLIKRAKRGTSCFMLLCVFDGFIYAADLCSNEVLSRTTTAYIQFPNEAIDYLDFKLMQGEALGAIPQDHLNDQGTELISPFPINLHPGNERQDHELKEPLRVKVRNGPEYELRSGTKFYYTLPNIESGYTIELPARTRVIRKADNDPPEYTLAQDTVVKITPPQNFEVAIEIEAQRIVDRVPGTGGTGTTLEFAPKRAPEGGYITLTVRKSGFDFRGAPFSVCLRKRAENAPFIPSEDVELKNAQMEKADLKVRIPDVGESGVHFAKNIDLQLVARGENNQLAEAVSKEFKVSSRGLAIILWVCGFIVPLIIIALILSGKGSRDWRRYLNPIRFASGKYGRASLSLAQILLWTMLVFSASFYVLVLSGKLLDISGDVLMLLGIAGGVSILSKMASQKDEEGRSAAGTPVRDPKWLDLFETDGRPDLLKIQMALFTVLAAVFVTFEIALKLEFPELPAGLVTLMGISSGAYLGAKAASKSSFAKLAELNRKLQEQQADLEKLEVDAKKSEEELTKAETKKMEAERVCQSAEEEWKSETNPDRQKQLHEKLELKREDLTDATVRFDQANQRKNQADETARAAASKANDLQGQFEKLKRAALVADGYKTNEAKNKQIA